MDEAKKDERYFNVHGNPLFPKLITDKEGKRIVVNSPEEEEEKAAKPEDLKKKNEKKDDKSKSWP